MAAKPLDLTGQKYGRLTAIERTEKKSLRNYIWKFRCDCGNEIETASGDVRRGAVRSCGCLASELSREKIKKIAGLGADATRSHGMTATPTFISWDSMKQRCLNSNHKSFSEYGGRGIKVCDRWLESFENFLADMGERPDGKTLDRKDTDGNYEPNNCRWATYEQQGNNRRSNVRVELEGRVQTVAEWAREFGVGPKTLMYRLKHGLGIKEALTMKTNRTNRYADGVAKL